NGVVYRGRGNGVLGAHFSCMNTGTNGICLIGNYVDVKPSAAAISSLENLLASVCCEYQINPSTSAFHSSSQLDLPHISSHRDGNPSPAPTSCAVGTECPGDSLYAQLPSIRNNVAGKSCLATTIRETERPTFKIASNPGKSLELLIPNSGSFRVSVFNAVGQLFYTVEVESTGQNKTTLEPLGNPGVYLVRVENEGEVSQLMWQKME
ncbi:MAG: N-acetylmuramoyl-L-alanine amidase, partial [Bacteroidota bacterium]